MAALISYYKIIAIIYILLNDTEYKFLYFIYYGYFDIYICGPSIVPLMYNVTKY